MRRAITQSLFFVVLLAASAGTRASPAYAGPERPPPAASASGTGPEPGRPVRSVVLTINPGVKVWPPDQMAVLNCAPIGGTHPKPREACAALDEVDADLNKFTASPETICTTDFNPINVWAAGSWNGRDVASLRRFPNTCWMLVTLGSVGAFWRAPRRPFEEAATSPA